MCTIVSEDCHSSLYIETFFVCVQWCPKSFCRVFSFHLLFHGHLPHRAGEMSPTGHAWNGGDWKGCERTAKVRFIRDVGINKAFSVSADFTFPFCIYGGTLAPSGLWLRLCWGQMVLWVSTRDSPQPLSGRYQVTSASLVPTKYVGLHLHTIWGQTKTV